MYVVKLKWNGCTDCTNKIEFWRSWVSSVLSIVLGLALLLMAILSCRVVWLLIKISITYWKLRDDKHILMSLLSTIALFILESTFVFSKCFNTILSFNMQQLYFLFIYDNGVLRFENEDQLLMILVKLPMVTSFVQFSGTEVS